MINRSFIGLYDQSQTHLCKTLNVVYLYFSQDKLAIGHHLYQRSLCACVAHTDNSVFPLVRWLAQ